MLTLRMPFVARWRLPEIVGLATLFLLFTRVSDLYRPREWPLSLNQLMVVLVLIFLIARRRRLVLDRGIAWMLVYGAAIAISGIAAVDHIVPLAAAMAYFHDVVIVVALLNLAATWLGFRAVTWTLIAAGSSAAALALVHGVTGNELGGLSSADFGNLAGDQVGYRLAGTIGNSNAFAQLLVCVVPLALYRAIGEAQRRWRMVGWGAATLMTTVIVWTYSRGGALGLLAVLALVLVFQRFRWPIVLKIALLLGVAALTAPRPYWDRLNVTEQYLLAHSPTAGAVSLRGAPDAGVNSAGSAPDAGTASSVDASTSANADEIAAQSVPAGAGALPPANPVLVPSAPEPTVDTGSLPEHTTLWRVGMLMFLDHPLTGIGKGDYRLVYSQYAGRVDPALLANPKNAHSTPVQILADTGLLGFAAFAGLLLVVLAGLRNAKRVCDLAGCHAQALLLEPVEIAIYGYLVTSLTMSDDYPRFLWILLGVAMSGRSASKLGRCTQERAQSFSIKEHEYGNVYGCPDENTGAE